MRSSDVPGKNEFNGCLNAALNGIAVFATPFGAAGAAQVEWQMQGRAEQRDIAADVYFTAYSANWADVSVWYTNGAPLNSQPQSNDQVHLGYYLVGHAQTMVLNSAVAPIGKLGVGTRFHAMWRIEDGANLTFTTNGGLDGVLTMGTWGMDAVQSSGSVSAQACFIYALAGYTARYTMEGGTLRCVGLYNRGLELGALAGDAYFTMSGGTIEAGFSKVASQGTFTMLGGNFNYLYGEYLAFTMQGTFDFLGGTMRNIYRVDGSLTNQAGIFEVGNSTNGNTVLAADARYLQTDGTTVFHVTGSGASDRSHFQQYSSFANSRLNLSDGVIVVNFAGGYTPHVSDSWDFVSEDANSTFIAGDGSNISGYSYDKKWTLTWDTSQWSNGTLTIANVVPEPAAAVGVLALLLALHRRAGT
jgi:hypothetical protein